MPGIDWEWVESNLRQNLSIWEPDPTIIENEGWKNGSEIVMQKIGNFTGVIAGGCKRRILDFQSSNWIARRMIFLIAVRILKKKGRWDRRGLVVGNVQSGKTRNYIGLINKAIDSGYRMVIVMAGVHNISEGANPV